MIPLISKQKQRLYPSPDHSENYFTFVARINAQQKDHLTVIRAFELLTKKHPDAKFYFIGDGPDRTHLETKVNELGLKKNILFTGTLNNPFPYIQNALANILSPFYERLPTVLLEDACLETLNIACSIHTGGTDEILLNGKAGILFSIGNAHQLANILNDILTGKIDTSEMIKNATDALEDSMKKQLFHR